MTATPNGMGNASSQKHRDATKAEMIIYYRRHTGFEIWSHHTEYKWYDRVLDFIALKMICGYDEVARL